MSFEMERNLSLSENNILHFDIKFYFKKEKPLSLSLLFYTRKLKRKAAFQTDSF